MRIAVTAGHNVYIGKYFDPGAVNPPITEADITKETVALLIQLLERQGNIVLDATPYGETFNDSRSSHVERCKRVDAFDADIYIDVHINAGGGTGVEVWVHNMNSKSVPFAKQICENISKDMLLANRGVKAKPDFWSVSLTTKPALIVEGCFIDNNADMEKLTPLKYATAIAKAFGEIKEEIPILSEEVLYRVQVGAYKVKSNAEKLLSDLNKAGFSGFISEEVLGVETIKNEFDYYETSDGLKVIEVDADSNYVALLEGKTLRELGIFGISGTWQNNVEAHLPRSVWGLAVNNNRAIGPNSHQNSPNGHKRGTIIYYEDGSIEVKRINNMNELTKPVKWALGGGMLIPDYNPTLEQIATDILRTTAHTGVGYKGKRVYSIVHPNCSMKAFRDYVAKLGLDGAIFVDGGGSTQMNWKDNKGIHSSRKLSHGLFVKGVK